MSISGLVGGSYEYLFQICYAWFLESLKPGEDFGFKSGWHDLSGAEEVRFKALLAGGDLTDILARKASPIVQATEGFDMLVMFGDSLSDQGRMYRKMLGLFRGLAKLDHSANGAFSDGINWVDRIMAVGVLSHIIDDASKGKPLPGGNKKPIDLRRPHLLERLEGSKFNKLKFDGEVRAYNFSEGGSSAAKGSNLKATAVMTLGQQRKEFLKWWKAKKERRGWNKDQNKDSKSRVRFFIMIGPNDLVTVNNEATFKIAKRAVSKIIKTVKTLYGKNFRHFIVGTVADLSLTPKYQGDTHDNVSDQKRINQIVVYFNRYLQEELAKLKKDSIYDRLSLDLYDINGPFEQEYARSTFGNPAGGGAPRDLELPYDQWRADRLAMTRDIDQNLYPRLGLTKEEYKTLLKIDLHTEKLFRQGAVGQRIIAEDGVAIPTQVIDNYRLLLDEVRREINIGSAAVAIQIRRERPFGDPNRDSVHLTLFESLDKDKRLRRIVKQRAVLRKIDRYLDGIDANAAAAAIRAIRNSFAERKTAYFYNKLHPSARLYNAIAIPTVREIMTEPGISRNISDQERIQLDTTIQLDQRQETLAYVHLKEARAFLTAHGDDFPRLGRAYSGMLTLIDRLIQSFPISGKDDLDKSALFILSSFLRDYLYGFHPDDPGLLNGLEDVFLGRASELGLLANLFHHCLFRFSGPLHRVISVSRSLEIFQSLRVLTFNREGVEVSHHLLNNEGLAVIGALEKAYGFFDFKRQTINDTPERERTVENREFLDEIQTVPWLDGFEESLDLRRLIFLTSSTDIKRFIVTYPDYFKEPSGAYGRPLVSRLKAAADGDVPEVISKWAAIILSAGIFDSKRRKNSSRKRTNILARCGMSAGRRKMRRRAVQMFFEDCNSLSSTELGKRIESQELFDRLVHLLPRQ